MPYSLHPYQYGYSSPLMFTDPSGELAIVIGGNGSERVIDRSGGDAKHTRVGVWNLGNHLAPLVGEVWKYAWNETDVIVEDVREKFIGSCPPLSLDQTHLISIGHSLGAATAQEVAHELESDFTIDLVVTLAMVTNKGIDFNKNIKYYPGHIYSNKRPNVLRHINIQSDKKASWKNSITSNLEVTVDNAENYYVANSLHQNLDNELIPGETGILVRNPAWDFIEQAIIDLSQ